MVAGIVLGPVWALVVAAASLASLGGIFWLDVQGLLPPSLAPGTKGNLYSAVAIPIVASAVLFFALVRDLEQLAAASAKLAEERLAERQRADLRATLFGAISEVGRFALETRDMSKLAKVAASRLEAAMPGSRVRVVLAPNRGSDLARVAGTDGVRDLDPRTERALAALVGASPGMVTWPPDLIRALFGVEADRPLPGLAAPILLSREPVGFVVGLPPEDPTCVPVVAPGTPLIADLLAAAYARSEAEYRMMQAQKLEVVGRLAGGVAHDFNNLLTAMRALVDDLHADVAGRRHGEETVALLESAIDRGALVAGQLLAVSKRPRGVSGPCDVARALRGVQPLLERLMPDECRLVLAVADEALWADVDIASLEQLMLNLVVNAVEAMPSGGTVTVTAEGVDGGIDVRVQDTGTGMDERVRARIFDPFFTTKADGTGLGMAVVRDITRRYGALVDVDSKPGEGTTITLRFRARSPSDQDDSIGESSRPDASTFEGLEVLLVEDNELVRVGVERMLVGMGCSVEAVGDGQQALSRLEAGASYDLLVTDLHMPGMSGESLAGHPVVRDRVRGVLIASGDRAPSKHVTAGKRVEFVEKPFDRRTLASAIRRVVGGPVHG
ncbi:MAG: response regulator [Deltaproteobacteria bacterium]|nr:MAG: response regulator [Deltaproteobacteria bacterium]